MLPTLPPDVQAFLFWLVSTPAALFSQLEKVKWFAALSPGRKLLIQAGLSALAAIGLTILAAPTLPSETLQNVNAVYLIIVQVITAIIANFGIHIGVNVIAKPAGRLMETKAKEIGPGG